MHAPTPSIQCTETCVHIDGLVLETPQVVALLRHTAEADRPALLLKALMGVEHALHARTAGGGGTGAVAAEQPGAFARAREFRNRPLN
jgi:hypothetical protein